METEKDIQKLVIARLKTFPEEKEISIGSVGELSKEELIRHVEKDDEIGKKIVEVEMNFLRMFKEGKFYEQ